MSINVAKVLHLSMPSQCKLHMCIISHVSYRNWQCAAHLYRPWCICTCWTAPDVFTQARPQCRLNAELKNRSKNKSCLESGFSNPKGIQTIFAMRLEVSSWDLCDSHSWVMHYTKESRRPVVPLPTCLVGLRHINRYHSSVHCAPKGTFPSLHHCFLQ